VPDPAERAETSTSSRIAGRVGACQSFAPQIFAGRLTHSLPRASPFGLPLCVTRFLVAPLCKSRKHSGLTQTPYSFQRLRNQESVPYLCFASSRARFKTSSLILRPLQLFANALANRLAKPFAALMH